MARNSIIPPIQNWRKPLQASHPKIWIAYIYFDNTVRQNYPLLVAAFSFSVLELLLYWNPSICNSPLWKSAQGSQLERPCEVKYYYKVLRFSGHASWGFTPAKKILSWTSILISNIQRPAGHLLSGCSYMSDPRGNCPFGSSKLKNMWAVTLNYC